MYKDKLREIELSIQPGLMRINWCSLGIDEYVKTCVKLLNHFEILFRDASNMEREIYKKLRQITNVNMFLFDEGTRLACKDFFSYVYETRNEEAIKLLRLYQSITPLLMNIEVLILHTNTGKSTQMTRYYRYWEEEIFKAFALMTLRNLEQFIEKIESKALLFDIDLVVEQTDIFLRPTVTDVYNTFLRNTADFLERLKTYPRWMDTTCLHCKPIKLQHDQDFLFHSMMI